MTPLSLSSPSATLFPPWTLLSWRTSLLPPFHSLAHPDQLSDCKGEPPRVTSFGHPNSQNEPLNHAPSTQPSSMPSFSGTGKGMALDFPPGIRDQLAYAISLTAIEDGLGNNLSAAVCSLKYINTWLIWLVAQRHSVPDVNSDALASCILALSSNVLVNGLFLVATQHASADSNLLFHIGSTVEELVNIPGVFTFTTTSEALA